MLIPAEYIKVIETAVDHFNIADEDLLAEISGLKESVDAQYIKSEVFVSIVFQMYQLVADPRFSFELGKLLVTETHGYFGYALKASKDLEQALTFEEKYMPVRAEGMKVALNKIGKDKFSFSIEFNAPKIVYPFLTEIMASCFLSVIKDLADSVSDGKLNESLGNVQLKLNYPEPPYKALYNEYLPFDVSFSQPFTELIGSQKLLNWKNPNYDPSLYDLMVRQVESDFHNNFPKTYTDRVRNFIKENLFEEIKIETVSAYMNVSERTLKRKLNLEGESFRELLSDIRLEESKKLIHKGDKTLEQISYQLGYKHASTFSNAFKQKYGISPKAYADSLM